MRLTPIRAKTGFTLIELLIVVVIIGILAAIAIPKFASTKQKAYVTSMKADLRNLVTIEEAYFYDQTTYASSASLKANGSYQTSHGNSVTVGSPTATGWSATATNAFVPLTSTPSQCDVWVGGAGAPNSIDSLEGSPACH
jgi:prepilin-type N-terminal cleavage/methylation domain-containing protein